jgi:hypothetical protein
MTANSVVSRKTFNNDLNNCLTILSNLTEAENIKSETYTYYKCEYISTALYKKIIIVAVYEN